MIKRSLRQPAEGPESKSHGMRWYWSMAALGVVLLVVLAWLVVMLQFRSLESDLSLEQVRSQAQGAAGRLTEITGIRKALLEGFSHDPELPKLFREKNQRALQVRARRIQAMLPDALRVRLLQVGVQEPDTSQTPHMGYASLEQLRQGEQRVGVLPAQVHQFGTPHQHISLVVSVRSSESEAAVGLIHAAFPIATLQAALDASGDPSGRLEVQQLAPNAAPFTLVHSGEERPGEVEQGSETVAGTIWRVAYWGAGGGRAVMQQSLMLVPGVVLLALIPLLFYFLIEIMRKALSRDQRSIVSLVEAQMVGRPPKQLAAQLSDMQPTLDVLFHQFKEHRFKTSEIKRPLQTTIVSHEPAPGIEVRGEVQQLIAVSHEDVELSAAIFRAYDIRGVVGETLTPDVLNLLGQSIGSEIFEKGLETVVVARDGRNSSEGLQSALIAGLQASGRNVLDIGLVPTPVLYFAAHELNVDCGVIVTGSHNPSEYNGLKIVEKGESLSPEAIQSLRRRIDAGQLLRGEGSFDSREIIADYIERITSDVRLARPMKLVIDCGNGAASVVAGELYRQLGCEVVELFCTVDGGFPNHHPDPGKPENMAALQRAVVEHGADLGLAFDGDGDRIGVVDSGGKLIWPDRLLMFLAMDVLMREPGGDIIYDVKCSRHLANTILSYGGRPLMWKSGHSLLKAKMKETHALLAGEFSGHVMFAERWYGFDDGLYAGARLLEILALDYRTSAEIFAELPESLTTPEYSLPLAEGRNREIMEALEKLPDPDGARVVRIDGLRIEFEYGWGLVRASNTMPSLLFRFESDTEEGLERVQHAFREIVAKADAGLKLPF
jgi:phosphomannomutase/phosphoglucomutase